jgi:AcrR family transcriptional regulator
MATTRRTTGGRVDRVARSYRSPLREQRAAETRSALLDAAHRLFLTKGWFGTGMRDVATEAGVAIETLYGYFSSKRALLQEVVDVAVVGDGAPIAVAERPEFTAIGRGTHAERTAAAARLLTAIYDRAAALAKVVREAAPSVDSIAGMLREARERQRQDVADAIELIVGREPSVAERDGVWALTSPEVYQLLVESSGWSADQYESWMADTLQRVIPRA